MREGNKNGCASVIELVSTVLEHVFRVFHLSTSANEIRREEIPMEFYTDHQAEEQFMRAACQGRQIASALIVVPLWSFGVKFLYTQ